MTTYYKIITKNANIMIPNFPRETCATVGQNQQQLDNNKMVLHASTFIKVFVENPAVCDKSLEVLKLIANQESEANIYAMEVKNYIGGDKKKRVNNSRWNL
jgi:hypothetical protein